MLRMFVKANCSKNHMREKLKMMTQKSRCVRVLLKVVAPLVILGMSGRCLAEPLNSSGLMSSHEQSSPEQVPAKEKTAGEMFKNVQVLKDIPASQLLGAMRFIAASLGVECQFCHVADEKGRLQAEKDDKPTKQTARKMISMMMAINRDNFAGKREVTCASCHHGQEEPTPYPPIRQTAESVPMNRGEAKPVMPSITPDQVIDKYVQALGGEAAIEKVKSIEGKGTLLMGNGRNIPIEALMASPDRYWDSIDTPRGKMSRGFDGATGWRQEGANVSEARGPQLDELKHAAQFNRLMRLWEFYRDFRVMGEETIDGHECNALFALNVDGTRTRLYFDTQSGLLLRMVEFTDTVLGPLATQMDFEDYREVSGVKGPFTIRVSGANSMTTRKFSDIQINVAADDSKFQKPSPVAGKQ